MNLRENALLALLKKVDFSYTDHVVWEGLKCTYYLDYIPNV